MGSLIRTMMGVPGAILVTVGLFLAMYALISKTPELNEQEDIVKIDINAKVPEIDQVADISALERPVLDTPPPPRVQTADSTNRPTPGDARYDAPDLTSDKVDISPTNLDRDAQPVVRIPPQYPDRCQARADGEEFVVVQFDVDPVGQPRNIRVLNASSSCFNRAAIRSVEGWKYLPKINKSEAVWRRGVVTRVTFLLSE